MKLVTLIALVEEEDDWRCLDEDQGIFTVKVVFLFLLDKKDYSSLGLGKGVVLKKL